MTRVTARVIPSRRCPAPREGSTPLSPLAAESFPVGNRAEDLRAEQTVALRLEGAVVDRLRLGHFAVRPRPDLLRRSEADLDGVEIVDRLRPRRLKQCVKTFQCAPPRYGSDSFVSCQFSVDDGWGKVTLTSLP